MGNSPLVRAAATQSDGSIITAGSCSIQDGDFGPIHSIPVIARYSPLGDLDASFGDNGMVALDSDLNLQDVSVQPDGKIVVALGFGYESGVEPRFHAVRLDRDGGVDETFDLDTSAIGDGTTSSARSLGIQSNGKIVLAGWSSNCNQALARYDSSGILDASFGELDSVGTCTGTVGYARDLVANQGARKLLTVAQSIGGGDVQGTSVVQYHLAPEPSQVALSVVALAAVILLKRRRGIVLSS